MGPVGRTLKMKLSFKHYFKNGRQFTIAYPSVSQWHPAVACSRPKSQRGGMGILIIAHHSLGDTVILLAKERLLDKRHPQLKQGRVALLPATLPLLDTPGVNQQQARLVGLQRLRVYVVHPGIPSMIEPDQAKVLHAIHERLALPVVVAAVAKEEEAGHVSVTQAKEVVEAGSAIMM